MDREWSHDPVTSTRKAAFQTAAARHRPGYRWLNARGTHWIEPVSEEEFARYQSLKSPRALHCGYCGGFFVGMFTSRRRFCSDECIRAAMRERREEDSEQGAQGERRSCLHCKGSFSVTQVTRLYCSIECRSQAFRQRRGLS